MRLENIFALYFTELTFLYLSVTLSMRYVVLLHIPSLSVEW